MRKYLFISLFILLVAFISASCSPTKLPEVTPTPQSPEQKSEWEKLLTAAQKEGTVVIYTSARPKARDAVTGAFKAKYGINVEWVAGRGAEIAAKIKSERNAGLYMVDLGFIGPTTFTNDIKPLDITPPLKPMFVLPEVKDPKNWLNGEIPFLDKEGMAIQVVLVANQFYIMNKDMVREGEVTSSLDLLNPKWKEKMVISDPSISGNANDWFTWVVMGVFGEEKGQQFMKDLVAQKPVMTRDERLLTEWVARGKYPIGIGPSVAVPAEFIEAGAHIAFISVKDPRPLSSGSGLLNAFKNAPHPDAAKLLVNWVLSKEGSSIFAPASEYPSTRADVPPEGILPILVPRPGDINPEIKFEDYLIRKGDMRKLAADIFKGLQQ